MEREYGLSLDAVLAELQTTETGLTTAQAEERLQKYDPNKLKEAEKPSLLQRFLSQLKDPMLIILMIAAAVSALTGMLSGENEWTEVIIILAVVLLNAILGVVQESKAEAAIEALQTMTAAACKVLRDGKVVQLHSDELVPGDVVILEAGDAVPADGRIIECASLKIEEAALTGESVLVNKMIDALNLSGGQSEVPLGDRKNMCYIGSTVVCGRGKAVITRTGMDTEMGKIVGALAAAADEETPLQRKLDQLGKTLSWIVLGICVFIFGFNLLRNGDFSAKTILDTFMVAVSLAVAAIPEGLATVVTVVLSIGVTNMSKRNAVIRKLTAVETLGCTQVICSDKTGMIDPVRPEVKAAIEECRTAGIRPVMITGDHKDTAVAIAKELGIITDASEAITGAELDRISDDEICELVKKYGVYARVQPEHKTRIVTAWKLNGSITAMTGDGVNDAPSIKSADIGVGMGITGTDVTKNVADMVLADDNFATIVAAAGEGRRIYDNIRKAIQFLLASNMSEVLGVFTASLIGFVLLNPVHLLFINLVTDCFPALALGMEKAEPDTMRRPPRNSKDGIFAGGLGFDVIYQGLLVTVITIAAYLIGSYMEFSPAFGKGWFAHLIDTNVMESGHGMTMAFLAMSMCEIFHSFNMRSQRKSVFSLKGQNMILWAAMLGSLLLTTLVIEVPFLADAFGFTTIGWLEYGIAMGLAVMVIPIVEFVKLLQRAFSYK